MKPAFALILGKIPIPHESDALKSEILNTITGLKSKEQSEIGIKRTERCRDL